MEPHPAITVAAVRHFRVLPACQALRAWLEPYADPTGLVGPHGCASDRARRDLLRFGIRLRPWGLQNYYALNRLALGVNVYQVMREMGLASRGLIRAPLYNAVSSTAAEEFFGLTPRACGRPHWAEEVAEWR